MKTFGFLLGKSAPPPELAIPAARMARLHQTFRRRLDDGLEALFDRACDASNLDAAADLLAVMEKWHAKRTEKYGQERRINDTNLVHMRARLERLTALRTC